MLDSLGLRPQRFLLNKAIHAGRDSIRFLPQARGLPSRRLTQFVPYLLTDQGLELVPSLD